MARFAGRLSALARFLAEAFGNRDTAPGLGAALQAEIRGTGSLWQGFHNADSFCTAMDARGPRWAGSARGRLECGRHNPAGAGSKEIPHYRN
jgi:hypothetical protein